MVVYPVFCLQEFNKLGSHKSVGLGYYMATLAGLFQAVRKPTYKTFGILPSHRRLE
jgi:hypothetical protein